MPVICGYENHQELYPAGFLFRFAAVFWRNLSGCLQYLRPFGEAERLAGLEPAGPFHVQFDVSIDEHRLVARATRIVPGCQS